MSELPKRIVVDQNGNYWRDFGDSFSMCPVSDDNEAMTVVASYDLAPAEPAKPEPQGEVDEQRYLEMRTLEAEQSANNEMNLAMERGTEISDLQAELSRLKSENERLEMEVENDGVLIEHLHTTIGQYREENEALLSSSAQREGELQERIAELERELETAKRPRFGEKGYSPPPLPKHEYQPSPGAPWICAKCGYPEHERMQHRASTAKGEGEV